VDVCSFLFIQYKDIDSQSKIKSYHSGMTSEAVNNRREAFIKLKNSLSRESLAAYHQFHLICMKLGKLLLKGKRKDLKNLLMR